MPKLSRLIIEGPADAHNKIQTAQHLLSYWEKTPSFSEAESHAIAEVEKYFAETDFHHIRGEFLMIKVEGGVS